MTPLAWLLGFLLPACGTAGAQGLPAPSHLDVSRIERPSSPNTALAAPAGFRPIPDLETPLYSVPADRLYDAVLAVAQSEPRTFLAASYPEARQVHYVVRSAVFNFPDQVTVTAMEAGPGSSTLVIWSRSLYGRSDLGVNRSRIARWLQALDRRLHPP
jgi:uncharacterized protein (DUF1499 family)